jgi:hypothetical protein
VTGGRRVMEVIWGSRTSMEELERRSDSDWDFG